MVRVNDTFTFNHTSYIRSWSIPTGTTRIKIEAYGAEGGKSVYSSSDYLGGKGGKAWGELDVRDIPSLYITVGGKPTNATGGFNGGGNGAENTANSNYGGGGGGATDVRIGSSTGSRVIVAGGGGGAAAMKTGGDGGGLTGDTGSGTWYGYGGTQSSGGRGGLSTDITLEGGFNIGGSSKVSTSSSHYGGGGGGGGYYGGGAGGSSRNSDVGSGGGGSSYIGGVENAGTTSGVNTGHGYVVITVLEADYVEIIQHDNEVLNSVSDRNKIYEYTVQSNSPTVTVHEVINTFTIKIKTVNSGERNIVSISEEDWNDITYGKYQTTEGKTNNLALTALYGDASERIVHNFTKVPDVNTGLGDTVKAIEDANTIYLPALKNLLADKISQSPIAPFEELIEAISIENLGGSPFANGTSTGTADTKIVVRGLSFSPRLVIVRLASETDKADEINIYVSQDMLVESKGLIAAKVNGTSSPGIATYTIWTDGFTMDARSRYTLHSWIAVG